MDIVVRTPHGVADVAIVAHDAHATLHDLLSLVTGQAVPPVAEIDGRAISSSTTLTASGLLMGSVVDTTSPQGTASPTAPVALLQLAGAGAGIERPLVTGRYRIGPGRRLGTGELDAQPVEITAAEIDVDDRGSVVVRPGHAGPLSLNGERVAGPVAWQGGMLAIEGRVFAVEIPAPALEPRKRLVEPGSNATIPFTRSPRSTTDGPRHLLVDAVRDAVYTRPTLWRRRATDLTAFTVPFGLAGEPLGPITVDLAAERGVALVGSERFTTGLARTLLIEAATMHGPADLDVVVASRPDRLSRWDWVKWLPHARGSGTPSIISHEPQLHEWAARLHGKAVASASQLTTDRLTLLVVDDPDLWSQRDSALVPLLSSQPGDLRVVALTEDPDRAPAACTATVTETDHGRGRLTVPDRRVDVDGIVPALAEPALAERVARHLAPLDDTERPTDTDFSPFERGPGSIRELLRPVGHDVDRVLADWARVETDGVPASIHVPAGLASGSVVTTAFGHERNVLVSAGRHDDAADVALPIVLSLAATIPPGALSIVHIASDRHDRLDVLDRLPHAAGRFVERGSAAASRLVRRLAHLTAPHDPERNRVLVVVGDGRNAEANTPGLVDGLVELAASLPALQILVVTDAHLGEIDRTLRSSFAVQISVDDTAGVRRGSLRVDSERLHRPVVPYATPDTTPGPGGLVVRPAVYGRSMTSLERRLDLLADRDGSSGDDEAASIVAAIGDAAERLARPAPPTLVPSPLPEYHRAVELFEQAPGDAIPLGLVDRPEETSPAPFWWQPGDQGSMLLLGSPRSGVDDALSTLILGTAARFSADDLHLYSIDALTRRRVAAGLLPHTGAVAAPEQLDEVERMLAWLSREVMRRIGAGAAALADAPAILLLVHDLGQLRRSIPAGGDAERHLRDVADAAPLRVNVVATAARAKEADLFLHAVGDRLVGSIPDPSDYELLGVRDPQVVEDRVGRCWSTTAERLVQLATPPTSLAAEVAAFDPERATARPPVRPADLPQPGGRP